MLVLTRRLGEKILIGNDIVITIAELEHNKVRIGIDAPKQVVIKRAELLDREAAKS